MDWPGGDEWMGLRRARPPSIGIEALSLYALLRDAGAQSGVLGDEQDLAAFVSSVTTGLAEALADKRRLHGRWAQDLFQAVVVSLDDIRMIKEEDAGTFYFDQAGPQLKLPDFRVVRRDGEQLLVEVKNVAPAKVFRADTETPSPRVQRLRATDVEAQRRYAKMTGARLVFAHYWAGINLWTVVDFHVLRRKGKHFELDIGTAMAANEFGLLGDRMVATTATLVMSLFADPDAQGGPVGVTDEDEGGRFIVGKVEFCCNGKPLADPIERRIAHYLFFFGSGEATVQVERDDEGRPARVDIISSAPAGSDSPMVGSYLSSMYSARCILATKQPDGTVIRFGHDPGTGTRTTERSRWMSSTSSRTWRLSRRARKDPPSHPLGLADLGRRPAWSRPGFRWPDSTPGRSVTRSPRRDRPAPPSGLQRAGPPAPGRLPRSWPRSEGCHSEPWSGAASASSLVAARTRAISVQLARVNRGH
jgi:hypothetical protein